MIRRLLFYLDHESKVLLVILNFFLVLVIGAVDMSTGYEMSLTIFYLLPIGMVTWFVSKQSGLWFSVLSAFVWLVADTVSGHPYSHPLIPYWNTATRFGFFVIFSLCLSKLRATLEKEADLARRDVLTGLPNSRSFHELAAAELKRATGYSQPLTLAHVVADGLQLVNERFGRVAGDQVLCTIAHTLKLHAPAKDLVARLGGAEFAVLLPETDSNMARIILGDIQRRLRREMQTYGQPMTFSIGAVTCKRAPQSVGMLIHEAERLTDRAKESKLDNVRVEVMDSAQPLLQ